MSAARERILASVRAAVSSRPRTGHPGALPAGPPPDSIVSRFTDQFRANGGDVVRFESAVVARQWLDAFARDFEGVACERIPRDLSPALPGMAVETAPLGVSTALAAAAESGTLLLDSGEGRRQQLLPPVHLVWVRERDIDATLGEALMRARNRHPPCDADPAGQAGPEARPRGLPAAIGLHSAPSKSADIGRVLVTGVHGPGRVIAAILAFE